MRKFLLAAALLAGSSAASAAPTVYGLSFTVTDISAERQELSAVPGLQRDFTGTFTFDPETNQLIFLDALFSGPGRDFTAGTVSLLDGSTCDLECFVGALESGSFSYDYNRMASSLSFGAPLSGTVTLPRVATATRSLIGTGTIRFNGAVPEPGTWLMMLLGFGAIGVVMRKQGQLALSL